MPMSDNFLTYIKECNYLIKANSLIFVSPIALSVLFTLAILTVSNTYFVYIIAQVFQFAVTTIFYIIFVNKIGRRNIEIRFLVISKYILKIIGILIALYSLNAFFIIAKQNNFFENIYVQTTYLFLVEVIKPYLIALVFFHTKFIKCFSIALKFIFQNIKLNLPVILATFLLPTISYIFNNIFALYLSQKVMVNSNYLFSFLNIAIELYVFIFVSVILKANLFPLKEIQSFVYNKSL